MNDRFLTNKERVRRHLSSFDRCLNCLIDEESVDHVLRNCPMVAYVWNRVVRASKLSEFMAMPFKQWFISNLQSRGQFVDDALGWDTLFPTLCWMLWKRRCSLLDWFYTL
ncbi:hypothetical protein V6N11_067778 [Hibiscus sabdariffa]|uniref:Reverse transcriptase zinc-binding domain-containing protein n=1 Tax=Hibiscus sabdariffa TaxID=183260 RepID=A0ABR2SRU4_9ROSI